MGSSPVIPTNSGNRASMQKTRSYWTSQIGPTR